MEQKLTEEQRDLVTALHSGLSFHGVSESWHGTYKLEAHMESDFLVRVHHDLIVNYDGLDMDSVGIVSMRLHGRNYYYKGGTDSLARNRLVRMTVSRSSPAVVWLPGARSDLAPVVTVQWSGKLESINFVEP